MQALDVREEDRAQSPRALRLIIAYKLARGALSIALAIAVLVLLPRGLADVLEGWAEALRAHFTHALSLKLAELLFAASNEHRLRLVVFALVADGLLATFEGWALWSGRTFGPWIVVATTAALMPFEVVALTRRPTSVRLATLVLNLAIVAYLTKRARRHHATATRAG